MTIVTFILAIASTLWGIRPQTDSGGTVEWPPREEIAARSPQRAKRTPPSMEAFPLPNEEWRCSFGVIDPTADRMRLAGSFNGWNPNASEMRRGDDGLWRATLTLPSGTHYYKFVANDDRWMPDPRNPERVPDGHGGENTVFALGDDALFDPGAVRRGDGRIVGEGLKHDPGFWRDFEWTPDGRFAIACSSLSGDVESVEIVFSDGRRFALDTDRPVGVFDRWSTSLPADRSNLEYTFIFTDGALRVRDPETYRLEREQAMANQVRTPDWAKNAIWYQIMVERFHDGTPENDPDPMRPWTSKWYEPSPWEGRDGQTFYEYYVFDRHYGGDLQGLKAKLPYLKSLGVDAIYLNPIFQASTHHKYNATDYRHVDESYGTGAGDFERTIATERIEDPSTWIWSESDLVFLDVLKEAKKQGFRVILDGVFNHVGTAHPAFQDVKERGVDSPYADWFSVRSWSPFEYDGWAGFGELPAFRKNETHGLASEALREHIFAVTRRWMDPDGDGDPSDGIDGWRLDVPEEVPMAFWIEWCELVRSINPDAYIVGEIWNVRPEWLDGRTFDAVMNYPFAEIAYDWVGARENKITASEADRRFADHRHSYPSEVTYALQNLLDSHDTDRLVSKVHNPDRPFDSGNREQEDDTYDGSKPPPEAYERARLLALLQMTSVGAPMIYYGDEVGVWGSDDPNNRKPMLWKELEPYEDDGYEVMDDHLAFYRAIVALRRDHAALRTGSHRTVLVDDGQDVIAFLREDGDDAVLVALNASDRDASVSIPVAAGWTPTLDTTGDPDPAIARENPDRCTIPARGGRVWVRATGDAGDP